MWLERQQALTRLGKGEGRSTVKGDGQRVGMAGGKQCQMIGQCPEDTDRMGTAWLWEQGTAKDFGGLVHFEVSVQMAGAECQTGPGGVSNLQGQRCNRSNGEAPCTVGGRWWHASRLLGDVYKWLIYFFFCVCLF